MIVAVQIMNGVIDGQPDGDTGNEAGRHRKMNAQPPNDTKAHNYREKIGKQGYQSDFGREKHEHHNAKNKDQTDGYAFNLTRSQQLAAGRYRNTKSGNLAIQQFGKMIPGVGQNTLFGVEKIP